MNENEWCRERDREDGLEWSERIELNGDGIMEEMNVEWSRGKREKWKGKERGASTSRFVLSASPVGVVLS